MTVLQERAPNQPETTLDVHDSSRHIKLSEVFDLCREHGHVAPEHLEDEPESQNDCLIAPQGAIRPFHFDFGKQGPRWAKFENIAPAATTGNGRSSHTGTYGYDLVFAPYKLIIAERDNPIRALITSEPVYPTRAKLGVLRPQVNLWLGYAAVAVLNSRYGQAAYVKLSGKTSSPDGLDINALKTVPIARRDFQYAELGEVAGLVHQITMLWLAREECTPLLGGVLKRESGRLIEATRHYDAVFEKQIQAVMGRLDKSVSELLGYTEQEELSAYPQIGSNAPLQLQMFELSMPSPPLPPPVRLLSGEDLAIISGPDPGDKDTENRDLWQALLGLRYWEENINSAPAREAWREECRSVAA